MILRICYDGCMVLFWTEYHYVNHELQKEMAKLNIGNELNGIN